MKNKDRGENMDCSQYSAERCVLCLDTKRSPVHIQCGHSFCFHCLAMYKAHKNYAWANKCPICRRVFRTTKAVHWIVYVLLLSVLIALCIGLLM